MTKIIIIDDHQLFREGVKRIHRPEGTRRGKDESLSDDIHR